MVIICECGDSGEILILLNAHKRRKLWDECMKECEDHLKKVQFDQIIKKVYGDISSPYSKTDSESSSSGSVDILMEMTRPFIYKEFLSYNHIMLKDNYISKLRYNNMISSIGNEEDVVFEPCVIGERVCITRPMGYQMNTL